MQRSHESRMPRALLACILIATVGQGLVLPFLFIYLTHVRHLDPVWAGVVGGWIGMAGLMFAPFVGSAVDRLGSRRVFIALVVVYGTGVAGFAFVHAVWQALLAASLASLGGAPLLGAYNTLLASVTSEKNRQWVFGVAFSTLNLGIGIGGILGGAIADVRRPGTFEALYVVAGATLLASTLPVLAMRQVGGAPTHDRPLGLPLSSYRAVLQDHVFRRVLVVGVLLTSVAYAQLEFGFPLFSVDVLHVSTRVVGWAFAANSLTIVATQLLVLRHIHGRSRSRMLMLTGLMMALAWLVLAAGTWASGGSGGAVLAVIACAVIFALGELVFSPVMPALTNVLASDEARGRYNALASMVFGVTSVVGPITSAPLIGHGLGGAWLALVILGALGAAGVAGTLRTKLSASQDGRMALATAS